MLVRLCAAGGIILVLLAASLHAQQEQNDTETIRTLVRELSDGDWRAREKAQNQLVLIGPPAAPFLKPLADDPVFETRFRAKEILERIHFVSPEDADVIEKCLRQYEPGAAGTALQKTIIALRRLKNVHFYLVEKMIADPQARERTASLLAAVEYRLEGRRTDESVSYSTDILLSLARDEVLSTALRLRALRALSLLADSNAAAVLAGTAAREEGQIGEQVLQALESVVRSHLKKDAGMPGIDELRAKWSQSLDDSVLEKAVKHLEVRTAYEEEESERKTPFLGVVKDETYADTGGAHVDRPWPDSGALKGGVEAGDIIVEFDGRAVENWTDMVHGLRRSRIGQKVFLKVVRNGKALELEVELGKRPEDQ